MSLLISLIALVITGINFFYSRIQSGRVAMTRPSIIVFAPEGHLEGRVGLKKIFVRMLLFSTSEKGQYIQNMFVRVQRGQTVQHFDVWGYGSKELVVGSGLFIDKTGISMNHHFILTEDAASYDFLPGEYILQFFVETLKKSPYKIFEQILTISDDQYQELVDKESDISYSYISHSKEYAVHIKGIRKQDRPIKYVS